jgi:hypothetical protein
MIEASSLTGTDPYNKLDDAGSKSSHRVHHQSFRWPYSDDTSRVQLGRQMEPYRCVSDAISLDAYLHRYTNIVIFREASARPLRRQNIRATSRLSKREDGIMEFTLIIQLYLYLLHIQASFHLQTGDFWGKNDESRTSDHRR